MVGERRPNDGGCMLFRETRIEVFERDGTSTVDLVQVHLPDCYVNFDYKGRTHRVQGLTARWVDGRQWRHQAQIIEYDAATDTYGAVEMLGISLGDVVRVLGEPARNAFPGLNGI